MNKGIVLGIIFLVIGMSFTGSSYSRSIGKSQMHSFDGNILYVGGNGTGNYTRIQDAIENASDGDTVFVYDDSSPYYERFLIDKSINLIGEDKNTTVIDGEWGGTVIRINADFVTISGFKIIRSRGKNNYGIVNSGRNTIITGNIFSNSSYHIYLNSNNTLIEGNYIYGGTVGIRGYGYFNTTYGLYNNTIANNTIISCSTGIYLMGNIRTKIVGNIINSKIFPKLS